LYRYYRCLQNGAFADCFGMTKDSTSCYMLVMRYYEQGDLYEYFEQSTGLLCWRDIVDMIWSLAVGLNVIHEAGLVHGHIHGGNILVENEADSIDSRIADNCLHGPVDNPSKQIYGAIPFVTTELFLMEIRQRKAGSIDTIIADSEICSGLRPSVIEGTPPIYSKLMLKCLDANLSNRPTAYQLYEGFGDWVSAICDDPNTSELSDQFDAVDESKFANL
ncbi:6006_t:CDS:2, partial [Funneliformis caledonium]